MIVKYRKVKVGAQVPEKKTAGAYCYDLICPEDVIVKGWELGHLVKLGIEVEVPQGVAFMIALRSGIGLKTPIRLSNGIGIVDSDYRGEISLILDNFSGEDYYIKAGDRIGQCYLSEGEITGWQEVEKLSETERGKGGYGSTGR